MYTYHWQHVVLPLDNRSSMCSSTFGSFGFENRLFIWLFVFSLRVKVRNSSLLRGFIIQRHAW